mmetsp:Transcript_11099/g.27997  ORF Transcript_11099/g.27997 Transcript_11099/m.27997 type:complete len:661 (-) Transcript_11099:83-2065(-)|eukprot:CAMPEP_0177649080 /NCGR_PEP_ID=MMETSP0447-20121125/11176_1 /TAXON_ID=0 /ORGANISM="Stygamoeba regulata, Strain BSH-02190019" /LENGTH=660 /DNA_ID=CAMNT_0019151775 /DNA_START=148 /DNA_END=2130 /DNA_ORIENTATION=+
MEEDSIFQHYVQQLGHNKIFKIKRKQIPKILKPSFPIADALREDFKRHMSTDPEVARQVELAISKLREEMLFTPENLKTLPKEELWKRDFPLGITTRLVRMRDEAESQVGSRGLAMTVEELKSEYDSTTYTPREYLEKFKELLDRIGICKSLLDLLVWDERVNNPNPEVREKQMDFVGEMIGTLKGDPHLGFLVYKLQKNSEGLTALEKKSVEIVRGWYDRYKSTDIEDEVEQLGSRGMTPFQAWQDAKEKKEYSLFMPYLSIPRGSYDSMLNSYSAGRTQQFYDKLFDDIKAGLVPVLRKIAEAEKRVKINDDFLWLKYPIDKQLKFSIDTVKQCGFDYNHGLLTVSTTAFACSSPYDTRIVAELIEDKIWEGVGGVLHELGHGLYNQGANDHYLPSSLPMSMGIHEGNSLMWERMVGQSEAFWTHFFPKLQAVFPEQLKGVTADQWYKAINKVQVGNSYRRIGACEVTYPLHVILRYELEKEMVSGKLTAKDLKTRWNEKMQEYLGCTPRDDAEGVLQDVHWAHGMFGYFPTYNLGTIYASMFYMKALKDKPDIPKTMAQGEFQPLLSWLKENIYKHGNMHRDEDSLAQEVCGKPVNAQDLVDYIKDKYGKIYGITDWGTGGSAGSGGNSEEFLNAPKVAVSFDKAYDMAKAVDGEGA